MSDLLDRRLYRQLDPSDSGPVYTFDIDKTYLETHLSNARDLLRIPFEGVVDKRPYAGMAELIRACQRGSPKVGQDRPAFFVSASPSQMRSLLERRMELDEIAVDGLTLKCWGAVLRTGRWARLRQQVAYKLTALLSTRAELPHGCPEILFGDDSEADALIYSLYSAILSGAVPPDALPAVLEKHGVTVHEGAEIRDLALSVRRSVAPVSHVFIHSVRRQRRDLEVDDRGIQPTRFSSALHPGAYLLRDGLITMSSLQTIYRAVRSADAWAAAEARDQVEPILQSIDPDWKASLFGGDWLAD